jgi:hypothetical protein
MRGDWANDPLFADLERLARRIEAGMAKANAALLQTAGLDEATLLDALAEVQSKMLGFDAHTQKAFRAAIDEKRVAAYARGSLVMAALLCSAVALSEFKRAPRSAKPGLLHRGVGRLRDLSTHGLALGAFTTATLSALVGSGAGKKLLAAAKRKTVKAK